jgi:hypothetical protein
MFAAAQKQPTKRYSNIKDLLRLCTPRHVLFTNADFNGVFSLFVSDIHRDTKTPPWLRVTENSGSRAFTLP